MKTNETSTGVRRNFDNCKVRIPHQESSKKVQERLFELGYVWNGGFKDILNLYPNNEWVYMNKGKTLTHSHIEYTDSKCNEVSVADILGLETVGFIPGTFNWAVDMMKQGKRVRQKSFANNYYFCLENGSMLSVGVSDIVDSDGEPVVFCTDMFEATDWEIFEEPKKTLWNKATGDHHNPKLSSYNVSTNDVKEALKEYRQRVWDEVFSHSAQQIKEGKIAEEEFGKELVE